MKKVFLLVVFALQLGLTSFAQDIDQQSNVRKGFDPYWYLNLNAGRTILKGDLASTPLDFSKLGKQTGFFGGIFGGYQFTPIWGVRGVITGGTAKGRVDQPGYKFSAKAHYFGYYVEPTLDITNLISYNQDRKFFLYAFTVLDLVTIIPN